MRYAATIRREASDADKKKKPPNDLDILDFTMVDLDQSPGSTSTTPKYQDTDLGGSSNNAESGHVIDHTQQPRSRAARQDNSIPQESTHRKRRAEWQDTQISSIKRVKLSSETKVVSPAGVPTEQIPRTYFQGETIDLTASSNDNGIKPSAPTVPDISDSKTLTNQHQLASEEIRAHPAYFELFSSLCSLSQSLSEQGYKLMTYLEKTTVEIIEPLEKGLEIDKRCRLLNDLISSFLEFEAKLSNATLWF